ncbi:MAG: oxidoreductase [Bacteroidetes bacterium SW_11_45_7]|nr:MAG: oxidoreductase [Bacteroidetes bacterium SW_11_45_7]
MPQSSQKTALLVGATGLVGSHCLDLLLASSHYNKVVTLTRRPLSDGHTKHENKVIDFDALSDYKDDMKADDVFCCLGTTLKKAGSKAAFRHVDYYYITCICELTRLNGASQFLVVTAIGVDARSLFFYNRVKSEVEDELINQDWRSLHIVRPSVLLGQREGKRAPETIAKAGMKGSAALLQGPLRKYRAIEAKTVAAGMVFTAHQERKGVNILESDEIEAPGRSFFEAHKHELHS